MLDCALIRETNHWSLQSVQQTHPVIRDCHARNRAWCRDTNHSTLTSREETHPDDNRQHPRPTAPQSTWYSAVMAPWRASERTPHHRENHWLHDPTLKQDQN